MTAGLAHDSGAAILALTGIVKQFGSLRALDDASITVRPGTLHALLGENGAGKTTLMRVAFGMLAPDAGIIRVDGAATRIASPADAIALGIGMVHQHFTVVPAMTVAENVALGGGAREGQGARPWRYDARAVATRVREVGERAGLAIDPSAIAGSLPVAAQQRLEIIKALARNARVLILDEPTAVLAPSEARDLLAWLRNFASGARAVVLITHRLRDAIATADDITVLRHGRTVASLSASDATEAMLAAAMLGGTAARELGQRMDARVAEHGGGRGDEGAVIRADQIDVRDEAGILRVTGATFEVARGEILGIAGVEGAGQRELLRALAGRLPIAAGTLTLPDAVGFIPEDRQRDALMLDAPLFENVALRGAGRGGGVVSWKTIETSTGALLESYDVRAPGPRTLARALSGGNQQKLVLGRELDDQPAALVAENPTRGLDIRATAAVHGRLRAVRDGGAAVILFSSDLDEVLALADRVLVMSSGSAQSVAATRENVGRAMLGLG